MLNRFVYKNLSFQDSVNNQLAEKLFEGEEVPDFDNIENDIDNNINEIL